MLATSVTEASSLTGSGSTAQEGDDNGIIKKPILLKVRATATAKQKLRVNKIKVAKFYSMALKYATTEYSKQGKKSAKNVEKETKKKFNGVGPTDRTITQYANEQQLVGISPLKVGTKGNIPQWAFQSVCAAFSSMVNINQLNAQCAENRRGKLSQRLNAVFGIESIPNHPNHMLLDWVLVATAIDLKAMRVESVEQRRILWMTFQNLDMWFDNWIEELVRLGFAIRVNENAPDDVYIPDTCMEHILNFDETCLSLDSGTGMWGGWPEVTFYNPGLPQVGLGMSKTAITTTLITGSSASGEAIPPHFQYSMSAKCPDTQRLMMESAIYASDVKCKFGLPEETYCPVSYGMNEKGGMDQEEFKKYVMNSIVPLFPDSDDVPGKRVMIKVDSGPGRLNFALMAWLKTLGFYMYPGVPNTTAVSQETDRNYGPFKTAYHQNLRQMVQA